MMGSERRRRAAIEHHQRPFPLTARLGLVLAIVALFAVAIAVPPGENPGAGRSTFNHETGEHDFVHDWSPIEVAAIGAGIVGGYLLLLSPLLVYKWPLGFLVPLRLRHRVHVWMGVGLLLASSVHGLVLPFVGFYEGWLSGTFAIVLLGAHGATGAWKARLVLRLGARRWRFLHVTGAWSALLMTLFHSIGVNMLARWMGYH